MEKIVEIKDVTFGYDHQIILENISLEIFKGDYLGIIGPNGSAKSTLLKLIVGTLKPHKGEIDLFGKEITGFKDWSKIGYVSQRATSFNKSFPATVEEIVGTNLPGGNRLVGGTRKK
jgi:zinc transport system ATP-binding protein